MTTPEEYEKSRRKFAWKVVQQLDVLHSELASLYQSQFPDPRRKAVIWDTIENLEEQLTQMGISYEHYATQFNR